MSYRVTSGTWTGGASLPGSTAAVMLPTGLLAQINASYPGWTSASQSGGVFTFCGEAALTSRPAESIAVAITSPGGLGLMAFTVSVGGGAPSASVTSQRQTPLGSYNPAIFEYAVPGTNTALFFQDKSFPSGATFTVHTDGSITTSAPGTQSWIVQGTTTTQIGSTQTLTVETLAAAEVGTSVLLSTGIGQGWTLGLVVSDGSTQTVAGLPAPLPATARAVALTATSGYVAPGSVDRTTYTISARSADAAHIWWSGGFVTSASLTTLGAILPGSLTVVETVPKLDGSGMPTDAGSWNVVTV